MIDLNFALQDVLSAGIGFLLFPLVIVIPGYLIGWVFNLFEFRTQLFLMRFIISVLLSMAISPVFYYLIISTLSVEVALSMLIGQVLLFLFILFYEKPKFSLDSETIYFLWIFLGWSVFVILSLINIQWGNQLLLSVTSYDQTTRVSVIDAITRTGVPPINPGYYPGKSVRLTFLYYFWYVLCSLVDVIGGQFVDARGALNASSAWSGVALMAIVVLYIRLRSNDDNKINVRLSKIGIGLLAVSGLDVIPITLLVLSTGKIVGSVDVWNTWIVSWISSTLWVPHHVGALVSGVVAILISQSGRYQKTSRLYLYMFIAGVALASAFGMSVWVTFVFVVFWIIWAIILFFNKQSRSFAFSMAFSGFVTLVLSSSFLLGIFHVGSNSAGSFPISFEVRTLLQLESFVKDFPAFTQSLIMLLALPINYLLELGFFFVAGMYWFKIKGKKAIYSHPYYFAELLLFLVVLVIGSFLKSTIGSNDLGWRSWLPGQFVLLIWGVDVLSDLEYKMRFPEFIPDAQKTRRLINIFIFLGILTTVTDASLLRVAWPLITGKVTNERYYSSRLAYDFLREKIPLDVITQNNPLHYIDRPSGLYGTHQMVISDRTAYGVLQNDFDNLASKVGILFSASKTPSWGVFDVVCENYSISLIIYDDTDPIWNNLSDLEVQRLPLYKNKNYAIFACGKYARR
ncbi:MAG: hypothetical protein U0Z26_09740 [Anaerolineales bacterium]